MSSRRFPQLHFLGGGVPPPLKRLSSLMYGLYRIQGCVTEQGMGFALSVLNRVYNDNSCKSVLIINRVLPAQLITFWFALYSKYTRAIYNYNVNLLNCNCQQMTFKKQDGVHFVLCPKQGNIEGVVLNRVYILQKECNIIQNILVQGFCPLKINIIQFPDGLHLDRPVFLMLERQFWEGSWGRVMSINLATFSETKSSPSWTSGTSKLCVLLTAYKKYV